MQDGQSLLDDINSITLSYLTRTLVSGYSMNFGGHALSRRWIIMKASSSQAFLQIVYEGGQNVYIINIDNLRNSNSFRHQCRFLHTAVLHFNTCVDVSD